MIESCEKKESNNKNDESNEYIKETLLDNTNIDVNLNNSKEQINGNGNGNFYNNQSSR